MSDLRARSRSATQSTNVYEPGRAERVSFIALRL